MCTFAADFVTIQAALAELVDAPDLGSGSYQSEGSSPLCRTASRFGSLFVGRVFVYFPKSN